MLIKAHIVKLGPLGRARVGRHLAYLERDGVARESSEGRLYSHGHVDRRAFLARSANDARQFRFVVSPENAQGLDLNDYTRKLVRQMERDLGTRLDWAGVNHHDTNHPHVHLVVRGKDQMGRDLLIAPRYLAHELRHRACDLATDELGPRRAVDIQRALQAEVSKTGLTSLDRDLQRRARVGVIALPREPAGTAVERFRHRLLRARLEVLASLDLADRIAEGRWRLSAAFEPALRALGTRQDALKTLQKAVGRGAPLVVFDKHNAAQGPVSGRVVDRGLADELHDLEYVIVEATDGRAYHVALDRHAERTSAPIGSLVTVRVERQSSATRSPADRNISRQAQANGGLYDVAKHAAWLPGHVPVPEDRYADYLAAHRRRVQWLENRGLVEPLGGDRWRIPADLEAQVAGIRSRLGRVLQPAFVRVHLDSVLPLEAQVSLRGPTWLDEQLIGAVAPLAPRGAFPAAVRGALEQRKAQLLRLGLAERTPQGIAPKHGLRARLRHLALDDFCRSRGGGGRMLHPGEIFQGTLSERIQLPGGEYAMISGSNEQWRLTPWQRSLSAALGRAVQVQAPPQRLPSERGIAPIPAARVVMLEALRRGQTLGL